MATASDRVRLDREEGEGQLFNGVLTMLSLP